MNHITAKRGRYQLIEIPGGIFQMGSPESDGEQYDDEGPIHEVRVASFYMGKYPVTNEEYELFIRENMNRRRPEYWSDRQFNQPRQPVVGVSWDDARDYAAWAGLRLPTEAEWEYACRAGSTSRYYTGNTEEDLNRAGWYEKNSGDQLHSVGEKVPNGFGLYDMHGNVWEWVEDDWHNNYHGAPSDGRAWIDNPRGESLVVRGGGWGNDQRGCRSAIRDYCLSNSRYGLVGIRLARSITI